MEDVSHGSGDAVHGGDYIGDDKIFASFLVFDDPVYGICSYSGEDIFSCDVLSYFLVCFAYSSGKVCLQCVIRSGMTIYIYFRKPLHVAIGHKHKKLPSQCLKALFS
jgi:hypothetical protein